MYSLAPDRFLSPDALLLEDRGLRNLLCQRKDQGQHVLCDYGAVNLARIREQHFAIH